jgi:hypothetical protein
MGERSLLSVLGKLTVHMILDSHFFVGTKSLLFKLTNLNSLEKKNVMMDKSRINDKGLQRG